MLLLTSTTDILRVVTSAAGAIHVHASWVDLAAGVVSPGRTNTPSITTATTTTVVASPAASTARNVKTLHVANAHATVSNTVTLQHFDNTTSIELESVTLAPGERLGYVEGVGLRVFDALGREKIQTPTLPAGNSNTADVTANAADTYLDGGQIVIAGRVKAGTVFRWRFRATKTAAGIASATFNIRTGTAGAVGDASRCLFTSTAAQTAATDTAWFDLEATLRVFSASAVLNGIIRMDHTAADAAGMGTFRYLQTVSSAFDITPAGTVIGVSCNPGASGVWTFQNVSLDAINFSS